MDSEQNYEQNTISLVDEEGVEHEFEVADTLEVDGHDYMALIPLFDDPDEALEDSSELVILRISQDTDDDGEPFLEAILDEDEYDKIAQLFVTRLEEFYDFEDEDDDGDGDEGEDEGEDEDEN